MSPAGPKALSAPTHPKTHSIRCSFPSAALGHMSIISQKCQGENVALLVVNSWKRSPAVVSTHLTRRRNRVENTPVSKVLAVHFLFIQREVTGESLKADTQSTEIHIRVPTSKCTVEKKEAAIFFGFNEPSSGPQGRKQPAVAGKAFSKGCVVRVSSTNEKQTGWL